MCPKICAHRGASYKYPENSLNSFQEAVKMRADSIEVDVRQTGDGHLVACHDFNLSRLTGKHQQLSEISLTEFQKLRINGLEPPATLEEILSHVGQKLDIILDVKENGLEKKILKMVYDLSLESTIIISSFDPRVIATTKRLAPTIKTALIAGPFSILPLAMKICFYLRKVTEYIKADYMHLYYSELLYPGYVTLGKWGYRISYWTVDRPRDIRNALSLNPESIITNRPDLARRLLNRLSRSQL